MQLGDPAEVAIASAEFAGEQEVRGRFFDGLRLDADAAEAGQVLNDAHELMDVGSLRGAGVPARWADGAADEDGDAFFFAAVAIRELEEDAAELEEAQAVGALADVQRGGGNEAWDDAGAQRGVVFAERILHGDAGSAAEGIGELGFGDEAQGLRFKAAAIDQGLTNGHREVVSAVRGIARHGDGGHFGRNAVETDDAGDFFDEIDGALEVGAVAGDGPAAVFEREAEFGQNGADFVAGEIGRAEELAGAVIVERDFGR